MDWDTVSVIVGHHQIVEIVGGHVLDEDVMKDFAVGVTQIVEVTELLLAQIST